jgi:hypothetical protein
MTQTKMLPTAKSRFYILVVTIVLLSMTFAHTALAAGYDEYDEYDDSTIGYITANEYEDAYDPEDYEAPEQNRDFVTMYNLRLRTGPSLNHEIIVVLPAGTTVVATNFNPDSEFNPVVVGNLSGYVATRYIRPADFIPLAPQTQPQTQAAQQAQPAENVGQAPAEQATRAAPPNGNIELLSWDYVRTIMPVGSLIHVYDIGTGLTYMVRNFSNGLHADVETLTQQDTNIMRQSSGGRYSWDPRPVLVTVNGRTIAAAINTMPHAGWTIPNNGMNGHICLHFFGSRPHNGNERYRQQMQAAVTQAFNHNR